MHPDENLSALIGRNASGKSSVLNGILLLKGAFGENGRPSDQNRASARSRINADLLCGNNLISLRSDVYYSATDASRDSVVAARTLWNFRDITNEDEWHPFPVGMDLQFLKYAIRGRGMGPGPLLFDIPRKLENHFLTLTGPLLKFFSSISYYSASQFTDPTKCPVSIEIEDDRIQRRAPRGAEHTRFLHDLYKVYKDEGRDYSEFLSIVGPNGLNLVETIHFRELELPQSRYEVRVGGKVIREKSRRRLLIPYFKVGGSKLSPTQLSEGTFKTIALLFYLVIDKGSLLLIEEPEVCVHHGLLKSIIELVKTYSATKQILVSTHSDFVLDSLEPENVFLVSKDRRKGTKVESVPAAMSRQDYKALKTYLADVGNLGEYWRHGGLSHD